MMKSRSSSITPLSIEALYRKASLSNLPNRCTSTKHLPPLDKIIGQERAQQAVEFAMSMPDRGYNIYAIGRNGLGKRTMVLRYLNRHQDEVPTKPLSDWCYVVNFEEPRQPNVLQLPVGVGVKFKKELENVIERLTKSLPLAFDNELYYSRSEKLKSQLAGRQEAALQGLTKEAKAKNISLTITPQGSYELVAMNGETPHTEESFATLSQKQKNQLEENISNLEAKLRGIVRKFTVWEEEYTQKQQKHDEQVAQDVLTHLLTPLKERYNSITVIKNHLSAMHKDILDNLDIFLENSEEQLALSYASLEKKMPRRYQINLIVAHNDEKLPIIVEETPNYHSIFGYIEHATFKGTIFSDFSLIRPGSLHKANGGVLMIDAIKVLEQPYVWDGLKRALRSQQLSLSSLEREVTLSGTISLDPQPIPLDVKIILFGDQQTYQLLQHYDPEFIELFKVAADFESEMIRTPDSEKLYAQFISSIIHENKMLHCDRHAIERIIEFSARQAADQNKLSLHSADIANLLREANFCARAHNANLIRASHVEQALQRHEYRVCRLRDRLMDNFANGNILISVNDSAIGQINALSVLSSSDHQFGLPNRITATTTLGTGKVIDIERKVELGGSIHSKGVMILTSYLSSLLGKSRLLPLSTHLAFEQSYGVIDGDSASMAEFCAILSAYSMVPLKQNIAITGSMNQFGETQAIGGVNEKIEGFYDLCLLKGEMSNQGVIIPKSNCQNLMLRADIIEAVNKEKFTIWPVTHVSQALALLTDNEVGFDHLSHTLPSLESLPSKSVLGLAENRLNRLRKMQKANSRYNS